MRVLIIGRAKAFTAESAMRRTLRRLGHAATVVDDRRLRQWVGRRAGSDYIRLRVRTFRPDRIIMSKPHDVEIDVLADICGRVPAVMWYRDLTVPPDPALVARAPYVDTVFLTPGGQAAEWEVSGARRALFLPDCADPFYERRVAADPAWSCDVAFVGRAYGPQDPRAQFLLRLAERFHVRVWGQGWGWCRRELHWDGRAAYGADFGRVCASAKIVLGIHVRDQLEHQVWGYQSNRMVKVLSAGGFFLGHATRGLRELFVEGEHCGWYEDQSHAFDQAEAYLRSDERRERIRQQGHLFALQHHTFANRLHNLLTGEPWQNALHNGFRRQVLAPATADLRRRRTGR
jgi:hypothetical protein